ncbi:hypothetical protein CEXT_456611 [Caerostris extrusa]|uniref:Uncharacterized protein n=1 Tax=Caerostris extrusa TaxID=172846 RepID=A0AAV4MQI7_CAEEX|nr:hypothetical protein CEXT_456611 [Caerostris extrusa]
MRVLGMRYMWLQNQLLDKGTRIRERDTFKRNTAENSHGASYGTGRQRVKCQIAWDDAPFFPIALSGNELPIMAPSIYRVVLAKGFFATPQQNDTVSIDAINASSRLLSPLRVICPGKLLKQVSRGWETAEKKNLEKH